MNLHLWNLRIANKVAADRESKDNNLEQNDIPLIKADKKKIKEDFADLHDRMQTAFRNLEEF